MAPSVRVIGAARVASSAMASGAGASPILGLAAGRRYDIVRGGAP